VFESRIIGSLYSFQLQPPPVGNSLFALYAVTVRPAPSSFSGERFPNVWSQAPEPQRCAAMTGMFFFSNCAPSDEQVRRERHVGNGRRRGRPREVPRKMKLHRNKAEILRDIMGALFVSRWSRPLSRLQSR
jgi:hypothetical protein